VRTSAATAARYFHAEAIAFSGEVDHSLSQLTSDTPATMPFGHDERRDSAQVVVPMEHWHHMQARQT
jgi:hypothetical protein